MRLNQVYSSQPCNWKKKYFCVKAELLSAFNQTLLSTMFRCSLDFLLYFWTRIHIVPVLCCVTLGGLTQLSSAQARRCSHHSLVPTFSNSARPLEAKLCLRWARPVKHHQLWASATSPRKKKRVMWRRVKSAYTFIFTEEFINLVRLTYSKCDELAG